MMKWSLLLIGGTLAAAGAAQAQSLTVIGDNAEAVACYRAAESDLPQPDAVRICTLAIDEQALGGRDLVATFVNRGIVRFRLAAFPAAIADFDAALELQPGQPDALINRGIAMLASDGEIDAALGYIERGIERGPQRPWVGYYGRAVGHELAGRIRQAYHDYQHAQRLRPGWRPAEQALARFTVRGG